MSVWTVHGQPHLIATRLGDWLEVTLGAVSTSCCSGSKGVITELMERYSDLPMDLADASLVLLAEHLGHGRILSTDQRDFRTYRWKQRQPFENLLLPEG